MGFKNERKIVKPKVLESFGIKLFMAWIKNLVFLKHNWLCQSQTYLMQVTQNQLGINGFPVFCFVIFQAWLIKYVFYTRWTIQLGGHRKSLWTTDNCSLESFSRTGFLHHIRSWSRRGVGNAHVTTWVLAHEQTRQRERVESSDSVCGLTWSGLIQDGGGFKTVGDNNVCHLWASATMPAALHTSTFLSLGFLTWKTQL